MGLKRTPLYREHALLGARLVDFAGWEMPVQYTGVIDEHRAVRSACGLFDVSHMGEIEVSGPNARAVVQKLFTNDIDKVKDGGCQYTLLCYPDGGVVDDCIVYVFGPERYLVCVNASNTDKAFEWMSARAGTEAEIRNVSADYAQIALQGPESTEVLAPLVNLKPTEIKPFHFAVTGVLGFESIVSRTGYTGEDGFEIYLSPEHAPEVWGALLASGAEFGIKPAGLGARDTLRLEMGYPLYGHELSEKITPVEAGLHRRFVSLDKGHFIGREVMAAQVEGGVEKTLVGLEMIDAGIPREGYAITTPSGGGGVVTSGTMSPSLGRAIAMAYVEPASSKPGTEVTVRIRNRSARAKVTKTPFYSKKAQAAA